MHTHKHTQEHTNQTDRETHVHTDKAVVLSGPVWPDHSRKRSLFSETYVHTYVCMYTCTHTQNLKGDTLHWFARVALARVLTG